MSEVRIAAEPRTYGRTSGTEPSLGRRAPAAVNQPPRLYVPASDLPRSCGTQVPGPSVALRSVRAVDAHGIPARRRFRDGHHRA